MAEKNVDRRGFMKKSVAASAGLALGLHSFEEQDLLAQMSSGDLIRTYEKAGLALRGTRAVPTDGIRYAEILTLVPGTSVWEKARRFWAVRREIVDRGPRIVPELLEDSLPIVAAQADAGKERYSRWILNRLAPDFVSDTHSSVPKVDGGWRFAFEPVRSMSRVNWLKEHRSRLRYDPLVGAFRLVKTDTSGKENPVPRGA